MANTQGFDLVAEITKEGILDILQGGWVSGILQKNINIPSGSISGIGIQGGQVQAKVLDVTMVPPGPGSPTPAGSIKLTFDVNITQVQLSAPPLPLLSMFGMEAHISSTIPVGSKTGVQDVALLFDKLPAADPNDVTLIPPDPIQSRLLEYITNFVHAEFHNGDFPASKDSPEDLTYYTCDVHVDLLDDPSDPPHRVQVAYPVMVSGNPNPQIRITVPIHAKIYNIVKKNSAAPDLLPLIGIETQLILTTTDLLVSPGFISADISKADVKVGTVSPAGSDYPAVEGINYTKNESILNPYLAFLGTDLATLIQDNLQSQGESLLSTLPATLRPLSFSYPKPSDLQMFLAQQIRTQMVAIGTQEIFPGPSTPPPQLNLGFVAPMVISDALVIAINSTASGPLNVGAIVNFVPAGDVFAIAVSASKTISMINTAKDQQFGTLPVVVNVGSHQVRLKSLTPSLTSAVHFSGDLTAMNVILGKWDVDASFDEDVGLEWLPPDPTLMNTQKLKANTGDPDVHLSGLLWLVTILAGFITDGIAGAIIGAVILDVVQQIASSVGSTAVSASVGSAIDRVGAWASPISGFKVSVNSAFHKTIEISSDGMLFGG